MGGLIILAATIVPTLLWVRLDNRYALCASARDDWMGASGSSTITSSSAESGKGRRTKASSRRYKLDGPGQRRHRARHLCLAASALDFPVRSTTLPFYKWMLIVPRRSGSVALRRVRHVHSHGTSNAVNLTDGLDGLAAGSSPSPR
jgi:phospho-N-acetylmuramoyl-pentapeptide-transferase